MAKRHACWVILAGTAPTAFHARTAEDLIPTLKQLQRTQPDTVMKWFERGRLWDSPVQALEALKAQKAQKAQRRGPRSRSADWRPGGTHEDPKRRYNLSRDEKRARFKRRKFAGPKRDEPATPGSRPVRRPFPRGPRKKTRE